MKNYLLAVFLLISAIASSQIVNIPDANFKEALLNHSPSIDTNNDGEIQVSEAEATLFVTVFAKGIFSLEGIQSFVNIDRLDCSINAISNLDLSQNILLTELYSEFNQLQSLNISNSIGLTNINCSDNDLVELDVSNNINLVQFYCDRNQLLNLDVSQNENLEILSCRENQISNLNISQNSSMYFLQCSDNLLTNLDVTGINNLQSLQCGLNQLTNLDVTNNEELRFFTAFDNSIQHINVSNNLNLETLQLQRNQLSTLDVSINENLIDFSCTSNDLTYLNIKNGSNEILERMQAYDNPNLMCIQIDNEVFANNQVCDLPNFQGWCKDDSASYSENCPDGIIFIPDANFKNALVNENVIDTDNNGIPDSDIDLNNDGEIQVSEAEAINDLDINGFNIASLEGIQYFINLERLICHTNLLTNIDVTYSLGLQFLHCDGNQLTQLEASNFQNLIGLGCSNNLLTELDVSQNINLTFLTINNNFLTNLDVSENINLTEIRCQNNLLTSLNIKNGNNHNFISMTARFNSDLMCIQVDDVDYANDQNSDCGDLGSWCIDLQTYYSEDCSLGVEDYDVLSFTLYPNPIKDVLNISSEKQVDKIIIYSIQGVFIKEGFSNNINVSDLTSGIYFAKITIEGISSVKKFVKN